MTIAAEGTVTVIIPTCNRSEFAEAAVRSVLQQTMPVSQIILVDDGSSGAHVERLAALARCSSSIALVRHEISRGVAAARNSGLDRARGSHVLFLDDDDEIHPRLCANGLTALRVRSDAGAVVFAHEYFFTSGARRDSHPVTENTTLVPRRLLENAPVSAILRFFIPVNAFLVRRSSIGSLRFPEDLRAGADTYFWTCLAALGCRFCRDDRVCAYVHRHGGNRSEAELSQKSASAECYVRLISNDVVTRREDVFFVHLRLLRLRLADRGHGVLRHLVAVLSAPDLLLMEIGRRATRRRTWRADP